MTTVAVIGGGISGLSCALHIADQRPDINVLVLEASNRLGGTIHTDRTDGWVCESGPGSFVDRHPSTRRLLERLGLSDEIITAGNVVRRRYIRHKAQLLPFPDSPEALKKPPYSASAAVRGCNSHLSYLRMKKTGPSVNSQPHTWVRRPQ